MIYHLLAISVLGAALLWSLRLIYGQRSVRRSLARLIGTIVGWVLVFFGLATSCGSLLLVFSPGLVFSSMMPHLFAISVLGAALLWSLQLIYGGRPASHDLARLVGTISGWVLVFFGLAVAFGPLMLVLALVMSAMAVARYRSSERHTLFWALAVAAERGIPLEVAARAFAHERSDEIGLRSLRLAELLESGIPFPRAMSLSRNPLPTDAELAARIGYATDMLPRMLRRAAEGGNRFERLQYDALERLLYLLLIWIALLILLVHVTTQVFPTYVTIYEEFEMPLPALTEWVIQITTWPYALTLGAGLFVPLVGFLFASAVLAVIGYMGVRVPTPPLWNRWFGRLDPAIILRHLGLAVTDQRPLVESLEVLAQWYPRRRVAGRLSRAVKRIRAGCHWSDALVEQRLLQPADAGVLRAAERAGNLSWALLESAENSVRRLRLRIALASRIFLPLTAALLAVPIGLLAVAIFLPMIQLVQRLSG